MENKLEIDGGFHLFFCFILASSVHQSSCFVPVNTVNVFTIQFVENNNETPTENSVMQENMIQKCLILNCNYENLCYGPQSMDWRVASNESIILTIQTQYFSTNFYRICHNVSEKSTNTVVFTLFRPFAIPNCLSLSLRIALFGILFSFELTLNYVYLEFCLCRQPSDTLPIGKLIEFFFLILWSSRKKHIGR